MDYNSGRSGKVHIAGELEFTEHAWGHVLRRALPYSEIRNYNSDRPLLDELNTIGYYRIKHLVHETFPKCNISRIRQVYAPQMYGMYMLRHEEMKLTVGQSIQEKLLYHVTTESRAMESLDSGLDWRRTHRNKYGCGVSFSDDADYANCYADNFTTEETRVIMVCSVLVGETYVIPKQTVGSDLIVPPGRADTTKNHNGRVYMKYDDNAFYPLYFVYYQKTPGPRTGGTHVRAKNRPAVAGGYDGRSLEERCSDFLDATGYYDDDDTLEQMCSDFRDGIRVEQYQEDDYSNELYGDDLYADYFDD